MALPNSALGSTTAREALHARILTWLAEAERNSAVRAYRHGTPPRTAPVGR